MAFSGYTFDAEWKDDVPCDGEFCGMK
jgi:hypothetical protein